MALLSEAAERKKLRLAGGWLCSIAIFIGLFLNVPQIPLAQPRPTREYQIKASLLFNFMQFVRWPPGSINGTLKVCVFEPDPFGVALVPFKTQLIQGTKIETVLLAENHISAVRDCNLLFVPKKANINLREILEIARRHSVLTVGELPYFLDRGGIINLRIESNTIVFDISRSAAHAARLEISSKLLRLAKNVIHVGEN